MDERRKLAKEMKIKLVMYQRSVLAQKIQTLANYMNGCLMIEVRGEIFAENKSWLRREGFKIRTYEAQNLEEALKCPVVSIITINEEESSLSTADEKEACEFNYDDELDKEESQDDEQIDWVADKRIVF